MKRIFSFLRPLPVWIVLLSVSLATGEGPDTVGDLSAAWAELASPAAETALSEALVARSRFLIEAGEERGWSTEPLWEWARETLDLWERSPEIDLAREQYLALLRSIGQDLRERAEPVAWESAYRAYLEKGREIAAASTETGCFLLLLAESWLRLPGAGVEAANRAESLLLDAVAQLDSEVPLDAVHARLGALYASSNEADPEAAQRTEAVFHYRMASSVPGAREAYRSQAREALEELLQPEMAFSVDRRFLPQNEVRIQVRTRNIESVRVRVVPLADGQAGGPASMRAREAAWQAANPPEEAAQLDQEFTVRNRRLPDWRSTELRLGDAFASGWYGVRVEGAGLEKRALLMVTPLEVLGVPRGTGELLVWVVDMETGIPVSGAPVHALEADQGVLAEAITGPDGRATLELPAEPDWTEVHAQWEGAPGYFRRDSTQTPAPPVPWVLPASLEVRPGESIEFIGTGLDPEIRYRALFPDGSTVFPEVAIGPDGWITGSIPVPGNSGSGGPVFLEVPDGPRVLLSHIRRQPVLPVRIRFDGESIGQASRVFLNEGPLGVRVIRNPEVSESLPEFVRLKVYSLERRLQAAPEEPHDQETLAFESILPLDETAESTLFELPNLGDADLVPLKVSLHDLVDDRLLGVGFAALSQYRNQVRLTIDQHLLRPGESVVVEVATQDPGPSPSRGTDGELVLYRESWETRYVHRRRGTLITEQEYQSLPDRSLLSAAKTDFRLAEQGFVREEIRRTPMDEIDGSFVLPVVLERPGYYHIDYEDREGETRVLYPEGPLELWAVPESGGLQGLRSDRPRLITETAPDGGQEILVLLDRSGPSLLLDLDDAVGKPISRVYQSLEGARYERIEAGALAAPFSVRAFLVGDRRTDFLRERFLPESAPEWELEAGELFGLNPGMSFSWPFRISPPEGGGPVLWTFFAETDRPLLQYRLRRQEQLLDNWLGALPVSGFSMEESRPLYHPLEIPGAELSVPETDPASYGSISRLLALFPELRDSPADAPATGFQLAEGGPETGQGTVAGQFPPTAGKWDLTLLSAQPQGRVAWHQWLLSTELPIRTALSGPDFLRLGDRLEVHASLSNTLREPVRLSVEVIASGSLEGPSPGNLPDGLAPGATLPFNIPVTAPEPGPGRLTLVATGAEASSEAYFDLSVKGPSDRLFLEMITVPPGESAWEADLSERSGESLQLAVLGGLEHLLPELWPLLQTAYRAEEPLLAALGDWALVQVLDHHGITHGLSPPAVEVSLLEALGEHTAPEGGWAWIPGGQPDPWLSALIVWTLETFRDEGSVIGDTFLQISMAYLERVLVGEQSLLENRLFALQALSARALRTGESRPSRLQARSFLDFLHRRSDLGVRELSMLLQVAKSYRFREEIQLLAEALQNLGPDGASVFTDSLACLALIDPVLDPTAPHPFQQAALAGFSGNSGEPSWESVGGFLSLLGAFLWRGEFSDRGEVRIGLDDQWIGRFSLDPEFGSDATFRLDLKQPGFPPQGEALRIDASEATSPVLLLLSSRGPDLPDFPALPDVHMQLFRQFQQETLLAGTRRQTRELPVPLPSIRTGDRLQVEWKWKMESPEPALEWTFPIPAGLTLAPGDASHSWERPSAVNPADRPGALAIQREAGLLRIRMANVPPGDHAFSLTFEAVWAGRFGWPENRIVFPRTGERFQVSVPGAVTILPEKPGRPLSSQGH